MELKDKLVSLRKGKGLSQSDLSEVLNVSRQAVSRWEVGDSNPSTENLIALGKLYDVPLDELVHIEESQEEVVQVLKEDGKEAKEEKNQQDIYKEYHHIRKSIDRIGVGIMLILMVLVSCIVIYFITNREFSAIPIEDLESSVVLPEDVELGEDETITDNIS